MTSSLITALDTTCTRTLKNSWPHVAVSSLPASSRAAYPSGSSCQTVERLEAQDDCHLDGSDLPLIRLRVLAVFLGCPVLEPRVLDIRSW